MTREAPVRLADLARVVRSKNAGPRCLTLDVMFDNERDYARAVGSSAITAASVAARYGIAAADVRIVHYPVAHAIKIVMPRAITAGDPGDRDVYGAQQHAPMLDVMV